MGWGRSGGESGFCDLERLPANIWGCIGCVEDGDMVREFA